MTDERLSVIHTENSWRNTQWRICSCAPVVCISLIFVISVWGLFYFDVDIADDFSTAQSNTDTDESRVCIFFAECSSEFPMGPHAGAGTAGGGAEDRRQWWMLRWSSRRHWRQSAQFWYFHSFKPFLSSQPCQTCHNNTFFKCNFISFSKGSEFVISAPVVHSCSSCL